MILSIAGFLELHAESLSIGVGRPKMPLMAVPVLIPEEWIRIK